MVVNLIFLNTFKLIELLSSCNKWHDRNIVIFVAFYFILFYFLQTDNIDIISSVIMCSILAMSLIFYPTKEVVFYPDRRFLNNCKIVHFSTKLIGSSWNFCHRCIFRQESPHYIGNWKSSIGNHRFLDSWFRPDLPWRRSALSECSRFLLRWMECRRGLAMGILSVCSSVKRAHCDKTEERYV